MKNKFALNLTITDELREQIIALAKEDCRSISKEFEWLILQELKRRKEKEKEG